jgi:signal transduction histidine kinase
LRRQHRILLSLLAAFVLPSALLAALGLRALSAESQRAEAGYRERAGAAVRAVGAALAASIEEMGRGGLGALSLGAAEEPLRLSIQERQPDDPALYEHLRREVERLEREGGTAHAAERLRNLRPGLRDPWLDAWALSALGALEHRSGNPAGARAAWTELVERYPAERDARGLQRSFAARYLLATSSETETDELLALYAELAGARESLDDTATGALLRRVETDLAEHQAGAAWSGRFEGLHTLAEERLRELRFAELRRDAVEAWLAEGAAGSPRLFALPSDPLDSGAQAEHVLVVAERAPDGSWSGAALELARLARVALARPEIAAFGSLGFAVAIFDPMGGSLAQSGVPPEGLAEELAERPLAREPLPLAGLEAAAWGLDLEGFRKAERTRFALLAALGGAAILVAAAAAFATLRAVSREVEAAREREAFVAAVTHELKAPLAAIRLFGEVLARGGVEEPRSREFGRRTVSEADRLSALVRSVLELSRLEQSATAPEESLDLREVAAAAVDTFRALAVQRGFSLALHVPAEAVPVRGDRAALEGALLNLLDNALKHAERPHTIEVEVARDPSGRATLAVLDRGPGVPAGEGERIFEPFRRLGDELTRERPGVGLGLAIVQRVAAAHRGRAVHTSREGGGSRFALELPLESES